MKIVSKIILSCVAIFFMQNIFAFDANSPVGYWKTIDDVTGQPKAIIKITESGNGTLSGQVMKIWPKPGKDENEVCEACEGVRHNQRIVGMVVMEGLKQSPDNKLDHEWSGGHILDPNNGKTYHCYLQLMDDGQRLNVRGYIGMPLFGRTQTWNRVSGSSD